MSGEPEQEYFSDGITEDLITDLSKISGLIVIARNSTFTYKGKPVKVDQVGQELAVQYVLEGSVRKAGGRVRITAQLVDTSTGGHLWAERYDRDLEDIFALQDEVAQKIVSALAVKLTDDEQERLERRYANNLEAYDYFLRGLEYLSRYTKEANDEARSMFQRATDLDHGFAAAYGQISRTHLIEWSFGWTEDFQCLERALELAEKARALDDSVPEAPRILGELCLWKKQHDQAIALTERAIALNPNSADAIEQLGRVLSFAGKPKESIELVKTAMRLNPVYPVNYLFSLGHAYMLVGRYEEAIATLKRTLNRNPNFHPAHIYLAITYSELGRVAEAQAEAGEFAGMSSSMSWEDWRQRLPYKDEAVIEHFFDVLRKVGVKPW
jgi:adenylate cyclase